MNGSAVVTCNNCKRSWALGTDTSLFFQLDLCTRPCPWCEAYTLDCRGEVDDPRPAPAQRRPRDFEAETQR